MSLAANGDWSVYFSTVASAAATLTGLVFVAVSINLQRILQVPGLTGLAVQSLLQLLSGLFVATIALVPWQPPLALGIEIFSIGLVFWLFQNVLHVRYLRSKTGHPRIWAISRIVRTQLACVPICVGGVLLSRNSGAGMYWLAGGFFLSISAGVSNTWVLLVEILR